MLVLKWRASLRTSFLVLLNLTFLLIFLITASYVTKNLVCDLVENVRHLWAGIRLSLVVVALDFRHTRAALRGRNVVNHANSLLVPWTYFIHFNITVTARVVPSVACFALLNRDLTRNAATRIA